MELGEKGQEPVVRKRQLKPLRELCVLRGTLQGVLEPVSYTHLASEEPMEPIRIIFATKEMAKDEEEDEKKSQDDSTPVSYTHLNCGTDTSNIEGVYTVML